MKSDFILLYQQVWSKILCCPSQKNFIILLCFFLNSFWWVEGCKPVPQHGGDKIVDQNRPPVRQLWQDPSPNMAPTMSTIYAQFFGRYFICRYSSPSKTPLRYLKPLLPYCRCFWYYYFFYFCIYPSLLSQRLTFDTALVCEKELIHLRFIMKLITLSA